MRSTIRDLSILALATLVISFVIWLPFLLHFQNFFGLDFSAGFNTIYRNFDGLEYIVIAKSLYIPSLIAGIPQPNTPFYFASHFPLYPLFILLFSGVLGFLKSMLFVTLSFTVLSSWMFYFLVKKFSLTNHPLFLSFVFLVLPGRWVIVHSVGSPEPLFIFFLLACFYFLLGFEKERKSLDIWLAALCAVFAQLTRPPGILLFIALMLYVHWRYFLYEKDLRFWERFKIHHKYYPFLLIPIALMGIFYWYFLNYGDFFAYFHSGDNIHLTLPIYQIFNKHQFWVGDIWLEDVLYIFILGFSAGVLLLKKKLFPFAFFVLTFLGFSTLVAHRDISRYTLPIVPFVLIAYEKFLTSKEFKIVLAIIGLGIYLYSQNFIINNIAPVPNLNFFN